MSSGPTIPPPIVDCIAHAREPDVRELCAVADHIRADLRSRRVGTGGALTIPDEAMRLVSFRAAHAALTGCATIGRRPFTSRVPRRSEART